MHVTDASFICSGNNYMHPITIILMPRIMAVIQLLLKADHAWLAVMSSGAASHVSSNLNGKENMTLGQWKQTHGG